MDGMCVTHGAKPGAGLEVAVFALLALIAFILALFHVSLGSIDLVTLGLVFVAAHLMYAWTPWTRRGT